MPETATITMTKPTGEVTKIAITVGRFGFTTVVLTETDLNDEVTTTTRKFHSLIARWSLDGVPILLHDAIISVVNSLSANTMRETMAVLHSVVKPKTQPWGIRPTPKK
jgi:hypothetical protein